MKSHGAGDGKRLGLSCRHYKKMPSLRIGGGQVDRRDFLGWLKVEYAVEKPNQKLQNVTALAAADLAVEVKKARGKKHPPLSVASLKALKA